MDAFLRGLYVINDGKIIERGNHESLLAQSGFCHNLYMSQFKGRSHGQGNPVSELQVVQASYTTACDEDT
jgi:hypothetical protein